MSSGRPPKPFQEACARTKKRRIWKLGTEVPRPRWPSVTSEDSEEEKIIEEEDVISEEEDAISEVYDISEEEKSQE
ncbi:hypothetical protein AVEN_143764-1 [Araneus ventricosus]|uniref:Uncharacterized protein n=1 Tax=Araneus ventricosus TaxID=182803 RepID=A0A4Y2AP09_ARAVE|nr:hypothetical protein AVEN_143764-1 [Araneus ventricosus]